MNRLKLVILLALVGLCGCASSRVQPLSLRYYRRNLVLDKDNVLRIEKYDASGVSLQEVALGSLKSELTRRQIIAHSPITLHVHRYTSPVVFDGVFALLRAEGYENIELLRFRDPTRKEGSVPLKRTVLDTPIQPREKKK
jgi:hypothetical protein